MHAIPAPIVVDARAKIIWGESPEKVLAFLHSKSIGDKDAFELVEGLMQERLAIIRADGVRKAWMGVAFVVAPIAYYFFSRSVGYWSIRFFAALIVLGAVGLAQITSGLAMILRPRSVTRDLAHAEN